MTSTSFTFTNASLSVGVYTANHNSGRQYWSVEVFDNTSKRILPDFITCTNTNNLAIDLTTYGVITGTWTARLS